MNRREKILALSATCVVLAWLGLPVLHAWFVAPIEEKQSELDAVNQQLAATTKRLVDVKRAAVDMKEWRRRSLPPNPLDAQRQYQAWLTDLAQLVGFEELKITPGRTMPQGKAYTSVQVLLEGKTKMSRLGEFLYHFYRTDLAHRIAAMNVECPTAEGDPTLTVSLTAEGLAIEGAPQRGYLFPATTLTRDFSSGTSPTEIEVATAADFPAGTPLRVRIGNEYLAVLERDGNRWTVEGGRDATSPGRHAKGDSVELAPVWPAYADFTLDDFRRLVGGSPFVKPVPVAPPPAAREEVVRQDDAVKDTYLAASIRRGGQPSAWLHRRSSNETTEIHKQSQLDIGGLHAVVLDIQRDYVVIRHDDSDWRLTMGDSLSTMQKIESAGAGDENASEDNPGDANAAGTNADDNNASNNAASATKADAASSNGAGTDAASTDAASTDGASDPASQQSGTSPGVDS